jgi:hypothetical protein
VTPAERWPSPSRPDPREEPDAQLRLLEDYRDGVIELVTDAGIERSRTSSPDDFDIGVRIVEELAASGRTFTADTARDEGAPANVVGAVFRTLAARGAIVFVGVTTSTRISSHGRLQREWRSAR